MTPQHLLVTREEAIAVVQLNRPEVLNALNRALMDELVAVLEELDRDPEVRCLVLTGGPRAFAAGADIREFADASVVDMLVAYRFQQWERIRKLATPLIAAVTGFALGGGNELAMLCDVIVAGESARFGQPEINLGLIPGAGGTQRADAHRGQVPGDGADPHRPADDCAGGGGYGPGDARRPRRDGADGGQGPGQGDRRPASAGSAVGQGGGAQGFRHLAGGRAGLRAQVLLPALRHGG